MPGHSVGKIGSTLLDMLVALAKITVQILAVKYLLTVRTKMMLPVLGMECSVAV
jgi:hypothetical protein